MNFDALMDQNVSMRPRNAIIGTIAEKVTVLMNRTVISRPVMRDSSGALMLSAFLPDGDVMDIQIVRTAQMRPIAVSLPFIKFYFLNLIQFLFD